MSDKQNVLGITSVPLSRSLSPATNRCTATVLSSRRGLFDRIVELVAHPGLLRP